MLPVGWYDFESEWHDTDPMELVETMASQFNLKLVAPDEMTKNKEYIAFRYEIAYDEEDDTTYIGDFHFIKRHKTGHWTHKRGSLPVEGVSQKFVLADEWTNGFYLYNSELYLFEVLG
jgi:hypothetical protein